MAAFTWAFFPLLEHTTHFLGDLLYKVGLLLICGFKPEQRKPSCSPTRRGINVTPAATNYMQNMFLQPAGIAKQYLAASWVGECHILGVFLKK